MAATVVAIASISPDVARRFTDVFCIKASIRIIENRKTARNVHAVQNKILYRLLQKKGDVISFKKQEKQLISSSLRRYYPYQVKGFGFRIHLSRRFAAPPDSMRLFGFRCRWIPTRISYHSFAVLSSGIFYFFCLVLRRRCRRGICLLSLLRGISLLRIRIY